MRRVMFLTVIVFVFSIITGCKIKPTEIISNEKQMIVFKDATVEAYTRSLLKNPHGEITEAEVQKITVFGDSENGHGSFGDISSSIKTLDDFHHFKNLKKLVLADCNLNNLQGLETLTHLEELRLRRNNIRDITPLANLINLRILDLAENDIKDLSPLSNLVHLEQLLVEGTNINLDPLKNLSNLKELYVPYSGVSDITPLKGLKNITYLQLFNNNITDTSALNNMSHLKYLEISTNPINDISVLDNLPELTYISVDTENLSKDQLWEHLFSKHWTYSSTGKPLVHVDVTTVGVHEFARTYKIQIAYSKNMSQTFQSLSIDSFSDIETNSENFVKFDDVNNDGFLDLQILNETSTKGYNYLTFPYNKSTHRFVQN